jgi:predicted small secreted protein
MRRTLATASLCLTAAVALTACNPFAGEGDGGDLATKAIKANRAATSFTVKGNISDPDEGNVTVDLAVDHKGDCKGTVGLGGQGSMDLVKTGKTVYMSYDEKLLRAQSKGESKADTDAAVKMLVGHWVKSTSSDPDVKDLASMCDIDELLGTFDPTDTAADKGEDTTVDGQKAATLTEKDGKETYTMYVATEGTPYLLKMGIAGGDQPSMLTFSGFDKPVGATAPAKKDIVDLDD